MTRDQVERLKMAIRDRLPQPWDTWPGGYPDQVEAALIDAVLSIRANYGSTESTGVRGAVGRYREAVGAEPLDDLARLGSFSAESLTEILGNRQKTSGVTKAAVIVEAANNLRRAGMNHAHELDLDRHRPAYTGVHGLGKVTWEYFTMLLGRPGVKADTWITKWVSEAVGAEKRLTSDEANALVKQAASELGIGADEDQSTNLTQLDHAIWKAARSA